MEFELTMKQAAIRRTVRAFAEKEIGPIAHEIDQQARFPWEVIGTMKAMNLFGLEIPASLGGAGLDAVSYAISVEELSRVCAAVALAVTVHNSVALYPLYTFGTEEQRSHFVPEMASGERIGAFCLTEPNAGSDIASIEASAREEGDWYIVNAHKVFVTNGGIADVAVVLVSTDPTDRKKGMSLLLVERSRRGFSIGPREDMCGMRANPVCSLIMTDCKVPKSNILGASGDGLKIALRTLDVGRIGIAAQALGIAQASLEVSHTYAKQRRQFQAPLLSFQTIQNMLADTATEVEAARLLVYRAAFLKDKGRPISAASAMAKLFASELATRAASRGVQIHGAYGYTKSYAIERYYRDARITEIYEGSSEMQRMVIARALKESA